MAKIVGFVYAAATFCVDCATVDLGESAIVRMWDGQGAPSAADYGASTADDWPRDTEGNPVTILYDDTRDFAPDAVYCGSCGDEIIEEDERGFNPAVVSVDGDEIDRDYDEEMERVQVSFPAAENGEQSDADERAPLGWCNNAAITLDRDDDAVHLTISIGDPRGAFSFTVRRTSDGSLVMHFPTPSDGMLHMPLKELHNGTYQVGK